MVITHTYNEVASIPEIRVPLILRDMPEILKLGGVEYWNASPASFQKMVKSGVNPEYVIDLFAKSDKVPDSAKKLFIQRCIMRLLPLFQELTQQAALSRVQLHTFRKREDVNMIFETFQAATSHDPVWVATAYTSKNALNAVYLAHGCHGNTKYEEERDQQLGDIFSLTGLETWEKDQ